MTALAHDVSKLTDRYQTTVPSGVRKQLKPSRRHKIRPHNGSGHTTTNAPTWASAA